MVDETNRLDFDQTGGTEENEGEVLPLPVEPTELADDNDDEKKKQLREAAIEAIHRLHNEVQFLTASAPVSQARYEHEQRLGGADGLERERQEAEKRKRSAASDAVEKYLESEGYEIIDPSDMPIDPLDDSPPITAELSEDPWPPRIPDQARAGFYEFLTFAEMNSDGAVSPHSWIVNIEDRLPKQGELQSSQ